MTRSPTKSPTKNTPVDTLDIGDIDLNNSDK